MLVPETLAASTSPSPTKVPPLIATVAATSVRLSGSDAAAAPDKVTAPAPWVNVADAATLLRVGASLTVVMPAAGGCGALEAKPSLSPHVPVRVVLEPKFFGFSAAL